MKRSIQSAFVCAALCAWCATGCVGAHTQLAYVRDLLPTTVATRICILDTDGGFSEELALHYLTQKINASRYGIALSNTSYRSRRVFDYRELHVSLFEQTRESLTRKEVVYILEVKNFCGRRAVMVGVGNAFSNSYSYSREQEARKTAAALLALGAQACDVLYESDNDQQAHQEDSVPAEPS
jgi:hypothetical protein